MKESSPIFICSNCDTQTPKWAGRCLECGAWGTLSQGVAEDKKKMHPAATPAGVVSFSDIDETTVPRVSTGITEFDQVLGGGIVPGSLILLGGDPGIGKCVTADTRILDPSTGALLPITSWKDDNHTILALNQDTQHLIHQKTAGFHDQGIKPIIEVKTRLGKSLRCTLNHPLLTPNGWKNISDLTIGERIASPRSLPFFGNCSLPDHNVRLIAYALSDGSVCDSISVTAAIPEIQDDLLILAERFHVSIKIYAKKNNQAKQFRFTQSRQRRKEAQVKIADALYLAQKSIKISWAEWARRANISYAILNAWRRGECVPSTSQLNTLAETAGISIDSLLPEERDVADEKTSIARYLESIGLRHKKARTKSMPECIFTLKKEQLALFLKVLFSCDGSVYVNKYDSPGISYSTISPILAHDVQHLLLRFGFNAKLRTKKMTVNHAPYKAYELQLLGVVEVQRFLDEIGMWGRSGAKKRILSLPAPTLPSTHRDTIPTGHEFWHTLEEITNHISYKELSRQCGVIIHPNRQERPLTRNTVVALADTYTAPCLQKLAYNDIFWDEISEIIPAGEEHVYDITVPIHSNFVANDLIIHNSTVQLQIACALSGKTNKDRPVIYASGEESAQQVKMRFERLKTSTTNPDALLFIGETNCEKICSALRTHHPLLAIVDSIQTIVSSDVQSEAGNVTQVRACTVKLLEVAKQTHIPIIITGHVTKDGSVAGPKTLEHLVDTVLYLEGDTTNYFRLLKTVKNRFGSTNEIGLFEMTGTGLVEVTNPSELFLSSDATAVAGSATTALVEGSRAFLVPIQALTSKTYFGYPQRRALGIDQNRLQLLVAVLSKRLGVNLGDQDIHINVVGGLKITEPAADLAVCASILSSYKNKPLTKDTLFIGEVGLTGEIRPVSTMEKRLKEAEKLGFKIAYIPKQTKKISSAMQLVEIKNIKELEI